MKFSKIGFIGVVSAAKCPFGFESKDVTEQVKPQTHEHPRVLAGEIYLSQIFTCPGGAKA